MSSEGHKQDQINSVIKLFSNDRLQEALEASNTLIKDFPNNSLLFNIIGACYAGLGEFNLAIENYEKSININPEYARAHFNLGSVLQDLNSIDLAVKSYKRAIQINPEYAEAYNNIGVIFQSLEKHDAAIKSYEKAIEIQPDYVEALYSLGVTLQNLHQFNAAVKNFEKVIAIKPNFFELHNNLGVLMQKLGYFDKAVEHYKKALAVKPDFSNAFNNLGIVYHELGHYDNSLKSFQKAIALNPIYVEAHSNLGDMLQDFNRLDAAVKCYVKVLSIEPDDVEVNNNLGVAYQKLNQLTEAIRCYRKVLSIDPDHLEGQYNLGYALQGLNQFNEAIAFYEKAIAIKPDFVEAHNNLGVSLKELGLARDAINLYEKALDINPEFIEAYLNIGNALMDLGRVDSAIKYYQNALNINPEYAEAHNNLGISLMDLGKVKEAQKSYEQAIAYNPEHASAHHNLSAIKKFTLNDPQITQMLLFFTSNKISKSDKAYLCFALAKVNEDLGNQDELFKFLDEGNRLRKEELNFSLDEPENQNIIIKNLFNTAPSMLSKVSYEPSMIKPIFIVGMPRSGTSLVEQIISSHKEVYGAGELKVLSKIIIQLIQDSLTFDKIELSENTIFSVRQKYLDYLSSLNTSENVITDKWPLNFRNIGFILSAFPEAKIVHLKRDSRAICWSIYKHYFSERGNGWAYNQSDIAQFYLLYQDLMSYWHELYPNKIYDICYEDLTTNQEEETRKLLDYCGLDWDKNCLDFHKNTRAVKTASVLQVRKKIYKGSSQAWKEHEAYLQPLIKGLEKTN
jgi:tetratricopeptide (TPR) repeat protein